MKTQGRSIRLVSAVFAPRMSSNPLPAGVFSAATIADLPWAQHSQLAPDRQLKFPLRSCFLFFAPAEMVSGFAQARVSREHFRGR